MLVCGAGLMGHGIAQVMAQAGSQVDLYEPELERATAGRDRIAASLERSVAKGRLSDGERRDILARIQPTDQVAAASAADLVLEAVFEDEEVKAALFGQVDQVAPPGAIFATNTSSISIDRLALAVSEPRRRAFVGMHFFSPVPAMPLVELIRGTATTDATEQAVRDLAAELGKQVIVSRDRPGFIVNRILMPFIAESIRALEEGLGTAEDIDTGAKVGLNHPMGPLELADFIGLDVCLGIMRVLHEGIGEEHLRPPRLLEEHVEAGRLGQKTGEGFYRYPREPR
jgi:3-hydroxybutyryl-CoA dehydrogenase